MPAELYTVPVRRIDGSEDSLAAYEGNVLLIVNVASQCGLTPQYEGLEKVYERYRDSGLVVLGFPANEFGAQEPGSNEDIQQFCRTRFDVKFPLFAKIVVKGEGQHPLYQYLTQARPEAQALSGSTLRANLDKHGLLSGQPGDILWNFEKFLVGRSGEVVARFAPDVAPEDPLLIQAIEAELGKQ
jgi:glutathione peroxidase